ncbi:protein HOTHEAD-like [Silene latifolia]|uniref:protein HOTHEAD-like n=1 Tax=Silene latifolia TaxID=37657 RepID=UPI003D76D16E
MVNPLIHEFSSSRFVLVAIFSFFFGFCASETAPNFGFLRNAATAPPRSYYDYIVIGGGTSGCPLAATLSQNASVLLLERGGAPYGNPNITLLSSFGRPMSDPSPSSPAQRFISEDGVINARARVLGGGSCLNAGFYTRADREHIIASRWDPYLVNESYRWVEDVVAFEPPMKAWQSAVRDGLMEAGVVPYNGFTYEHVNGTKVGGSIFDQDGNRHTAADLLGYANATNIDVLLHATVHKIMFKTKGVENPQAYGVIFTDETGIQHKAYLNPGPNNEVILAAGALGSPQILMLSGVGPIDHLKAHNITVLLDNSEVGQGMSDNPMNAIYIPSPLPVEVSLIQVVGITNFGSYIEAASGENFGGDVKARDFGMFSPKIGQLSSLPPKQRTPEALAKAIDLMSKLPDIAFQGGFIIEKILGPISTGYLRLQSKNPSDNPAVTFNYFQDPNDLKRCVQGIQTIEKVINSKAFSKFKYQDTSVQALLNLTASTPLNLLPHHSDVTTSLEQYCRDTVMTIWHYHGGCQLMRVVDFNYKVFGTDKLRVIDGSTFYFSPGTNPQATVMMLGRYMGVKLLQERSSTRN